MHKYETKALLFETDKKIKIKLGNYPQRIELSIMCSFPFRPIPDKLKIILIDHRHFHSGS